MKVSKRSKEKFDYFVECGDTLRHLPTKYSEDGYSAVECFHAYESNGDKLPCREPQLLDQALNGKEQHGITITMLAEDYIDRILFSCEIESNYPEWVQNEIYSRAEQMAASRIGYTPTFIKNRADFTTLCYQDQH